jgi:hypothetical protein
VGFVASRQGDYASLRSFAAESITLRRGLGDKRGIALSLDTYSILALNQGQAKRAARLLGAADALREAIGTALSPAQLATHTLDVARVRSALGDDRFAAAWAEGRAMTLEQAIEYALKTRTRPEEAPSSSSNVAPE